VQWPESEPIPQNLEEALANGWEITGSSASASDDELTQEGTADLYKQIGMVELNLRIPFRAAITYGRPCEPKAIVEISNHPADRHRCQTLTAQ
jgi:hypothetical protein